MTPGIPLAEARALLQRPVSARSRQVIPPVWKQADRAADRLALQELARDCQSYTPLVGLEDSEAPESLLLDIAGCEHLHGHEQGLLSAITTELTGRGFEIRTALADTIGAAWAVAHAGATGVIVPADCSESALSPLPVRTLRIGAGAVESLQRLDIRTIGQLLRLPRASLPSRFGPDLIRRIDQAIGLLDESFTPERFTSPPSATWTGEYPLQNPDDVTFIFRQLLSQLLPPLVQQRAGILDLRCEFQAGRELLSLPIRLARPTTDEKHLVQLFELGCERQPWPEGVLRMRLEIWQASWLGVRQTTLFDTDGTRGDREVALWIERMTCRLGERAVLRAVCVPDPLPELSVRLVPWIDSGVDHAESREEEPPDKEESSWNRSFRPPDSSRPWRLFPQPEPTRVSCGGEGTPRQVVWRGRNWIVARAWGPERIETGWWRDRDVRRDYYRIETDQGHHLWVFRDRESGQWFLHGVFE